jgi:hypothetical protein
MAIDPCTFHHRRTKMSLTKKSITKMFSELIGVPASVIRGKTLKDLERFKEENELSHQDLLDIVAAVKGVEQKLKPNDFLLVGRPKANGRWKVRIYRKGKAAQ